MYCTDSVFPKMSNYIGHMKNFSVCQTDAGVKIMQHYRDEIVFEFLFITLFGHFLASWLETFLSSTRSWKESDAENIPQFTSQLSVWICDVVAEKGFGLELECPFLNGSKAASHSSVLTQDSHRTYKGNMLLFKEWKKFRNSTNVCVFLVIYQVAKIILSRF